MGAWGESGCAQGTAKLRSVREDATGEKRCLEWRAIRAERGTVTVMVRGSSR